MINDQKLVFSDAQNCFATDDSVLSTYVIDMMAAAPNQGAGTKKVIRVTVNTAITGGTSIQAVVVHATSVSTPPVAGDFSDDAEKLFEGPVVAVADAIPGKTLIEVALPSEHKRYVGILFVNVGANAAGKADAYLNITT